MELRMILVIVAITAVAASPVEKANIDEDLTPAEGRSQYSRAEYGPSHGGPAPLYAQSAYASPRQGHVSSYNRRGQSAEYGLRFSGQSAYGGPSGYAPAPISATYGHQQDERGYGSRGYGPSNSISSQPQQYSQDPEYDPSKDPVSQYAEYVPVREYNPKKQADTHREALSIYGYRK